MRYRWILFDADGTLFDFEAAQAAALRRTWSEQGLPAVADLLDRFRRINLALWRLYEEGATTQERLRLDRFADLLEDLGQEGDAEALAERYVTELSRQGRLFAGAEALLRDLAAKASLALVTNGIAEVQRSRIGRSGVADLFAAVVISGEVGAAKPDGRFFDAAFAAAGGPPRDEVVIVGDSLQADVRGGLAYGIDACWFNPRAEPADGGPAPTYEVSDYGELRDALGAGR